MSVPRRIKDYEGRYGLVDGIPYTMPINGANSDVIMAGFTCDFEKAKALMPDRTIHPVRISKNKAVFIVTIVDYRETDIGKYIEYSLALACHKGRKPGWPKLPAVFRKWYGTGQFILDLPVSTEVSVKGGKSIWGMPKHLANLDYINTDKMVTAQYEKDGQFAFRVEFEKPVKTNFKMKMGAVNYAKYRNLVMASSVYFEGRSGICLGKKANCTLFIGDHPRTKYMRDLNITPKPFFTAFVPNFKGILDDYFESWFCTYDKPQTVMPEGMESVFHLGRSEEWLPPPSFRDYEKYRLK